MAQGKSLISPISHFLPPAHVLHQPDDICRQSLAYTVVGTPCFITRDNRFCIHRLNKSGRLVCHTYDAYLLPASRGDSIRFIANLRLQGGALDRGFAICCKSGRRRIESNDDLVLGNIPNVMDGTIELMRHAASLVDDSSVRRSIEEAADIEDQNHRAWRRLFAEGMFAPFMNDEVLQILARSGSGEDAVVIARVAYSRHIDPHPSGFVPEHLYVLRAGRLADYARGSHDLPLVIQTPRGWSVGQERDFFDPRRPRLQGGQIETTWHKTIRQALGRAFSFYGDIHDSGHQRLAHREFILAIGRLAQDSNTLADVFPDMNARLTALYELGPASSPVQKKIVPA